MADASRLGVRTKAILRAVRPGEQGWVRFTVIALFAAVAIGLCVLGGVLAAKPKWGKEVIVTLSLEPGKSRVTFPDGKFDDETHLEHSHYLQWRDSWGAGLALKELPDGEVEVFLQNAGAGAASGKWDTAERFLPPIEEGKGVLGDRDVSRFSGTRLTKSFERGLDSTMFWLLERHGRMQIIAFDKERGEVTVRFQFRKPLAPLNAPTRGPAADEPIPSTFIYVPEDLLPSMTECADAFERRHPNLGAVRVDAPSHSVLGLTTKKGIGIADWRPERNVEQSAFSWMQPLEESTFGHSAAAADDGTPETTYYLYHWPQTSDGESAFLDWLAGAEAGEIMTKHGFVLERN
jgi:hypothetical protein